MASDQRLGILIESQNKAHGAIGQAIDDVKRFEQALKQAKHTADGSLASNQRLGKAAVDLSVAKGKLSVATVGANRLTQQLAGSQGLLATSLTATAEAASMSAGAFGRFAASLGGVGLLAGAVAGLGVIMTGLARHTANVAEESENLQAQLGMTARGVGALKVIAGESGVNFETLSMAVNRLNVRIGEARHGNEDASKAFRQLRVSLSDANGNLKTTEQLTSEVAQALLRVIDPAERARLSMETFGRGGTRGLRALASNAEEADKKALALGITIEGNVKAAAERADEAFDSLGGAIEGFSNSIGAIAAMSINPLIEQFVKLAEAIAKAAKQWAEAMGDPAGAWGMSIGPGGFLVPSVNVDKILEHAGKADKPGAGTGGAGSPLIDNTKALEELTRASQSLFSSFTSGLPNRGKFGPELPLGTHIGMPVMDTVGVSMMDAMRDQRGGIVGPSGENLGPLGQMDENKLAALAQAAEAGNEELKKFVESLGGVKTNTELANEAITDLGREFLSNLASGLASAIVQAKNLGEVLSGTIKSAAEKLLEIGIKAGLNALFPGAGLLFSGGGRPVYAASGLVVNGVNGIDSVNARVHRGEMFVSHTDTQNLMRTVRQMDQFMKQAPQAQGGDTFQIEINATGNGGQDWGRIARDELIREIQRHQRLRTGRR